MTHVPIAVEGLDDRGLPSGQWLEVIEVALIGKDGRELGRFKDAAELWKAMQAGPYGKLVATETTGEPRADLTCDFACDEQG